MRGYALALGWNVDVADTATPFGSVMVTVSAPHETTWAHRSSSTDALCGTEIVTVTMSPCTVVDISAYRGKRERGMLVIALADGA